MGTALIDLAELLIKQKNLTAEELNVLNGCKSKAIRQFTFNALVAGGGILAATWNRGKLPSLCLASFVAVTYGLSGLRRSLDSSADDILSLDGSRMQKELAAIMLRKHRDNPLMKHHLSKHFYAEEVYYDTSSEPALRWRFRNFFSDNAAYHQSTRNTDPQEYGSGSHQDPPTDSETGGNKIESSMTGFGSSPATVNYGNYLEADPLGFFFSAAGEALEEIDKPVINPSKGSRVERRGGHGRARRRRRMQRDDNSEDS